ncbi:MAG TPA: ABC transporter permease [Actinomycetota bacterium]|nr:ABC transporter permease [Actinomycetota bacterium]
MADQVLQRESVATSDDVSARARPRAEWMQEVLGLFRRWYLQLIRDRLNLVFSLTQPAIWLAFFGSAVGRAIDPDVIGTSDYLGFMLAGVVAFTVVTNAMSGAMPLLWDKEVGYLDKLLAMPIARSSLIVSRFLFQFALGTAQVVLVFFVALAVGVEIAAGPLGAISVLALAGLLSMCFTALFMALAYRVPTHGTFFAIAGFLTLPLVFLSNAFVPVDAMPGWMQVIARLNPLTYAIEAMRTLVLEGWTAEVPRALGVLAVFAIASLGIATLEFVRHTGERT